MGRGLGLLCGPGLGSAVWARVRVCCVGHGLGLPCGPWVRPCGPWVGPAEWAVGSAMG